MNTTKVNPIHFQPTWIFARLPDVAAETASDEGGSALVLSDAEMLLIRIALNAMVENCKNAEEARFQNLGARADMVLAKFKTSLNFEFQEDEPA